MATLFIALVLAAVIFLTQSLRFLELVIESGASSLSFWILSFLALPRFFEIILPLSLMAAVLFVYNRMAGDSELVVVRSVGLSPVRQARPALVLAAAMTVVLLSITMAAAPKALASMQQMRQFVRNQFSAYIFRDGVFNQVGSGLTVYMRSRTADGELHGMMIHDSRETNKNPSTIMAKRGVIVSDDEGHKVVVYDGSRQEYDPEKDVLHRLNFERYSIDLPDSSPVSQRWREPAERTIFELLNPDENNVRDQESLREFKIEIHRRIATPLLVMLFTLMACAAMLLGPVERRGYTRRIIAVVASVTLIQGLFLASFSLARQSDWGLVLMYGLVLVPFVLSALALSNLGEVVLGKFRRMRKATA